MDAAESDDPTADMREFRPDVEATADLMLEVPHVLEVLPDGRDSIVIGEVEKFAEYHHRQGDNPHGFRGTCGLCSCEGVLRQFGVDVRERDIVDHAINRGLCEVNGKPGRRGGTTLENQARILGDFGVQARPERAESLEELAARLEEGRGVIVAVNSAAIWNQAGYSNSRRPDHAVVPIGVARDPASGETQGFFVNDSAMPKAARFIQASDMADAWLRAGGLCVVTNQVHTPATRNV